MNHFDQKISGPATDYAALGTAPQETNPIGDGSRPETAISSATPTTPSHVVEGGSLNSVTATPVEPETAADLDVAAPATGSVGDVSEQQDQALGPHHAGPAEVSYSIPAMRTAGEVLLVLASLDIAIHVNQRGRLALSPSDKVTSDLVQQVAPFKQDLIRILSEPGNSASGVAEAAKSAPPRQRREIDRASDFLREILRGGEKPTREVEEAATARHIALPTLDRARRKIGVHRKKDYRKEDGKAFWLVWLPEPLEQNNDALDHLDHLHFVDPLQ